MTEASENYVKSVLDHAQTHFDNGMHAKALAETHRFLCEDRDRRAKQWNRYHEAVLRLHFESGVKLRKEKELRDGLNAYRRKVEHSSQDSMVVMQHLVDKLAESICEAESEFDKLMDPRATRRGGNLQILSQLTAFPPDRLASLRTLDRAMNFFIPVMRNSLNSIGYSAQFEELYQNTMRQTFSICLRLYQKAPHSQFGSRFEEISRMLASHMNDVLNKPDKRETVSKNKDACRAVLLTKIEQLRVAGAMGKWQIVTAVIAEVREFTEKCSPSTPADHAAYFSAVADVLQMTNSRLFHAFAAVRYARFCRDEAMKEGAASRAILAVLSVDGSAEAALEESSASLSKAFRMTTSHAQLMDDVRGDLLRQARPELRALFSTLAAAPSLTMCQKIAPLLQCVTEPELQSYLPQIESVAVRAMLSVMSKCFTEVGMDRFQALVAFFGKDEFMTRMEPIVAAASRAATAEPLVSLDVAAHMVRFSEGTIDDSAVPLQSVFAHRLSDAVEACFDTATRIKAASASATKVLGSTKDMLASIQRDSEVKVERAYLCRARADMSDERVKQAEERERERKEKELKCRQDAEEKRATAMRDTEVAKLRKDLAKQEEIGRREWVVKNLTHKHKDKKFVIPDAQRQALIMLPNDDFTEKLTTMLLRHLREYESMRHTDAKQMDHYQRACREIEAPRRQQFVEEQRAAYAEENGQRRENRHEKHRLDWESAIATKHRLQKFSGAAEEYQRTVAEKYGAQLKTKRGDQEALLAETKAALAREREKEESATPSPQPPAPSSPPPAAAPSAGAWKPRRG